MSDCIFLFKKYTVLLWSCMYVAMVIQLCLLQEAQAYAEENSLLFMETSAKTAMNVNDIFLAIGE